MFGTKKLLPFALLFLLASSYSLLFSVNKIAVQEGLPNIAYVFWHSLGGALLLLPVATWRGAPPQFSWEHGRTYLVWGLLSTAAPISLLTYAAPHLSAGLVTMILVLVPLITYALALAFRMERFRVLSVLGLLFGLGGILLVVVPKASLPEPGMAAWVLLTLLAPLCFGLVTVFAGKFRPPASPSVTLACGLLFGSAILLVPVMVGTGQFYIFPGPSLLGDLCILFASILTALVFALFLEIIRLAGPVFVSQHNFAAVLIGFGWGALFFGEQPRPLIWGATALMFFGLVLHTYSVRRGTASAAAPDFA
jgi:drug/metabolite transporter (DMT)-like permease